MRKVAFITGASSGIGYELALELARQGYVLALTARRETLLNELAEKVKSIGTDALSITCDVSDQQQVRKAIEETVAHFKRIDLAILSAGISEPTVAEDFSAADFEKLLRTNLLGVSYCLEELVQIMVRQRNGVIAAISSLAADRGVPGSAGYCATKAALSSLFEGMRVDLKRFGVGLVTIEPGYVRTPMTASFGNMPLVMEADASAKLILRRIESGDRVIRFPLPASILMKLMRVLPVTLFDLIVARRRPVKLRSK
ncbi:MAG: SDR family NAD(P)-dependent oxidoreductase [Acidobacteria bacterium]|nr:SDR family NAD(P)-dependent oxidoreductase [Acidobacteriota bacterium]